MNVTDSHAKDGGNTIRIGGSEGVKRLLGACLADALDAEFFAAYLKIQERELELIDSHAYEDALSDTDAAGPALEKIRAAFRENNSDNGRVQRLSGAIRRVRADGLDAMIPRCDARLVETALSRTLSAVSGGFVSGLARKAEAGDNAIMSSAPLGRVQMDELLRRLSATEPGTAEEPADAGKCRIIEFPERRDTHA